MLQFLTQEAQRKYFADNDLLQNAFNNFKKVHKCSESLKFLQTCYENKLTPKFLELTTSQVDAICLTPTELKKSQIRKLLRERDKKLSN